MLPWQVIQGLLTVASHQAGASQVVTAMTETANNSNSFTGIFTMTANASAPAGHLAMACVGATPCFINATYQDANFGMVSTLARTQASGLLSVSAQSQTAQLSDSRTGASLSSTSSHAPALFVAGEPLTVTVQDFVLDADSKSSRSSLSVMVGADSGDQEVLSSPPVSPPVSP